MLTQWGSLTRRPVEATEQCLRFSAKQIFCSFIVCLDIRGFISVVSHVCHRQNKCGKLHVSPGVQQKLYNRISEAGHWGCFVFMWCFSLGVHINNTGVSVSRKSVCIIWCWRSYNELQMYWHWSKVARGEGGSPSWIWSPSSTFLTRVTFRDHMVLQVFTSKFSLNSVILLTIIHYILKAIKRGALSDWG